MEIIELEEEKEETRKIPDINTVLTLHRLDKISIVPILLNNQSYVLRSKGYVGQIPLGDDLLLRINPKVQITNLFRMLEYAYQLKSFNFLEGSIEVESIEDIFERLASILAKRVLNRGRKGLYQGYVREEEPLPYLRGRVLVMPSVRQALRGSVHLECEYEEHTPDLEDNRILAWTLYQLPRFRIQRDEVRKQVRQAYRVLSRVVGVTDINSKNCINRFYHRLNEDYKPMHGLCRFFLEHCGPGLKAGKFNFIPFTLHMPSLFESFVAAWLEKNLEEEEKEHTLPGMHIKPTHIVYLDDNQKFVFKIDLLLKDTHNKILAVMDTKYKRGMEPEIADIQQIVAYATSMKTRNAFLIFPSNITNKISLSVGEIKVKSLCFDLDKNPDDAGKLFLKQLRDSLLQT